ncbi:hypothetical protein JCM10450v2_000570 [Rhodotorula kratochvilovae]
MPLGLLPDELLLPILEEVASLEDVAGDPEAVRFARRRDLRRFCLVSRRFRRLAQPILWQNVVVKAGPVLNTFLQHAPHKLASTMRTLSFVVPPRSTRKTRDLLYRFEPKPFVQLLRKLTKVEEIEVVCLRPADVAYKLLEAAPNLKKLAIFRPGGMFQGTAPPFFLPRLEHLEIRADWRMPKEVLKNLTSASVPSLRVVVLDKVRSMHADFLHPTLLAQLELLQANWQYARAFEELGRRGSRVVVLATIALDELVDAEEWLFTRLFSERIRHLSLSEFDTARIKDSVDVAFKILAQYPNLATLSIPSITATSAQRDEYQRLVQYAVEHDIKIIWNELAEEYDFDEAFYEYAKELRARGEV